MTPDERAAVERAARQIVCLQQWHRSKKRRGARSERYDKWARRTGDDEIEALVGGDARRWTQLASLAIDLAQHMGADFAGAGG